MRDHEPIVIEEFNGFWKRGDEDSCPIDHWPDCLNVQFVESGFETRAGLDTLLAEGNVLRIYTFVMQTGESLLILNTSGEFKHALLDGSNTVYTILTIPTATDFGFVSYNGRAYITPFTTYTKTTGEKYQTGLQNEFVYVYKGDGTPARKAAGFPPTNSDDSPFLAWNVNIPGGITQGIHVLGVAFTDGVDRSNALGTTIRPLLLAPGQQQAQVANLPIGPVGTTHREIYMTKAIDPALYDPLSLPTFFFVTSVDDNVETNKLINVQDSDLVIPFVPGTLSNPTSGGIEISQPGTTGFCDLGLHIIGVVYETDTGFLTAPGPEVFGVQSYVNEKRAIRVDNIPVSPSSAVVKRHLISSAMILDYNGDDHGYQMFFIPGGNIDDNVTTTKTVSYYDADLIEDASHLFDNFSEIPAGVTLTTYHSRLVLTTTFNDISLIYLSAPGEPEAIDQIDNQLIMPLDGIPVTTAQEYRDVLYTFKKTRTMAWVDNGDVPSTWQGTIIDQGIGASVHGIATVLDSGGVNIEYILIVDFSGIMVFNGAFARPELTWKIQDFWKDLERNDFANIQLMNDSLTMMLYMTLPDRKMLIGDYKNGLNPQDIRWAKWEFDIETTTITLIDTNTLVIGAEQLM